MGTDGPIRRAQLISPVGVGALTVLPDGTSVIIAGLDHWYETGSADVTPDPDEFMISEWRLEKELGVSHFRLPPDYRSSSSRAQDKKNLELEIPALRFPTWHFCSWCRGLYRLTLSAAGRRQCPDCSKGTNNRTKRKWAPLAQVPLVAICSYGHIQEFPWREWVHKSREPTCDRGMYLTATGAASLGAQVVSCDCKESRSLGGTTELTQVSDGYTTYLSTGLEEDKVFLCRGVRPWHGTEDEADCQLHLKASQRAASNLHYSIVRSSVFLPRSTSTVPEELFGILGQPTFVAALGMARDYGMAPSAPMLRNRALGDLLSPYSDEQIEAAVKEIEKTAPAESDEPEAESESVEEGREFRRAEYNLLRDQVDAPELIVRRAKLDEYGKDLPSAVSRLTLVERLRETRALLGFNRIYGESSWGLKDRKALLRSKPVRWSNQWLPAYVVHGEGLFFELNHEVVAAWAERPNVKQRAAKVSARFEKARTIRNLQPREITPKFLLVHTLAHALINELTYESGYSSVALRERLYVADDDPMTGVLIYTAAGDAEGTMGGLVRLGRPGNLERTFRGSLEAMEWCSTDPVCMEIGEDGQGPDSCNMAACYGCVLVAETACEEFNRFLDRGMLVGTLEDPSIGFFCK